MANVTFATPGGAEDTAALANIGEYLGLGRPATLAEIKAEVIRHTKSINALGAQMLAERTARGAATFNLS